MLLRGYQRYEAFQSVIKILTNDAVKDQTPEKSDEKVLEFIAKQGRVAPVEIQAAFKFSAPELQAMMDALQENQRIVLIPAGNGFFIERATSPLACDPDTGLCHL